MSLRRRGYLGEAPKDVLQEIVRLLNASNKLKLFRPFKLVSRFNLMGIEGQKVGKGFTGKERTILMRIDLSSGGKVDVHFYPQYTIQTSDPNVESHVVKLKNVSPQDVVKGFMKFARQFAIYV